VIGQTISHYRIVEKLGEGGMGVVYRAEDTHLSRDVAIKVLPADFAADAERLARFAREAKLLASLNHPNVAAVHGFEEVDGTRFLVLEAVEGEDLSARLARGPVPPEEAVDIARQIAAALEEAHEKGIVHRDLKPGNVKLTPDGKVKVLDFGLAKAWAGDPGSDAGSAAHFSQSPTLAQTGTLAGVILGTAAYMSPEQARGRPVDKRADIWSFGVVLFEMLTGRQLFTGAMVSDVLASVLKTEPDWDRLPRSTPVGLRRLLRRCLERDARQRLRDIGDARWELERVGDAAAPVESSRGDRKGMLVLAAIALVASAAALWSFSRGQGSAPPYRVSIPLPEGHALMSGPAISPDGMLVAFSSTDGSSPPQLYVRSLTEATPRLLPGTEEAFEPFFSPDGRSLGFFKGARGLWRTSVDGGSLLRLADAPVPFGGTWGEDDSVVFTPSLNGGLYRMRASGGDAAPLLNPAAGLEYACVWPRFLPGGRELLFTSWGSGRACISRLSLPGLERVDISGTASSSAYLLPGFLIRGDRQGGIRAQPYDRDPGSGLPVPTSVLAGVYVNRDVGRYLLDVSRNGTLAYAPGDITQASLSKVDLAGRVTPTSSVRAPYQSFAASPDGRRMAAVYDNQVWVQDLQRGSATRIAPERNLLRNPRWAPDGGRIAFCSLSGATGNFDIYESDAAGVGPMTTLLEREADQWPESFAPDGTLAFVETNTLTGYDILLLDPNGTAEAWLATPASEISPRFSPDGGWLAYSSDQSGRVEVFVRSRSGDEQVQVSISGGTEPAWSPNGDRLFFRSGHRILSASITLGPRLEVGQPEVHFDGGWALAGNAYGGGFEVAPSGTELFMIHREPAAIPDRIDLIFNWGEEVRKLVEPGDAP